MWPYLKDNQVALMTQQLRQDPYNGFNDDRERRRALNTRVRWYAVAMVSIAASGAPVDWMEKIRWLMRLMH